MLTFNLIGLVLVSRMPAKIGLDEVISSAARASGIAADHSSWKLDGSAHVQNADQTFDLVFDGHLRYRSSIAGVLPSVDGYDGTTAWISGPTGLAHPEAFQARDAARLLAWTQSGEWAKSDGPLTKRLASGGSGPVIELGFSDSVGTGRLTLDPNTYLPTSLEFTDDKWSFDNYKRFGKRSFATTIVHKSGAETDTFDISSACSQRVDRAAFAQPQAAYGDVDFVGDLSTVAMKRVGSYMFIRPKIDGQDVGWFFLDTGADAMCIDPAVAEKLNMDIVGADSVNGAVAVDQYKICRGKSLELGGMTFKRPVYLELDLSAIGKALGLDVAGVCGYDMIARADLDVDTQGNLIHVYRPGAAKLPGGATWTPIRFDSNTPCTECAFAGGDLGIFSLDTGSGNTVDFCSPAVDKYHLLERKDLKPSNTGGAGGVAKSWAGPIDWFELGGSRFENPTVGFQVVKTGALATKYHVGNVGMGFMGQFKRLILDYAHERIAFVKN
ncbi:MAG TPA: retropepsin-like aspartic protease [Fimbriimonas sp.]|nr:retropepsin-like aspartic protease [Fimbriimonas sp.]